MSNRWLPLGLLLAACRFETGGVAADGGVPPRDLAPPVDASGDARGDAGPCAADAGVCCGQPEGRRVCHPDTNASASCVAGEPVEDRECPPGSGCEDFTCTLETACQQCTGSSCGAGRMCSIFRITDPSPGVNYCCTACFAGARGCGSPGAACGVNADCASGICMAGDGGVGDAGPPDGGSGQCFYVCQDSQDCGDGGAVCVPRLVSVDGLTQVLSTCRRP